MVVPHDITTRIGGGLVDWLNEPWFEIPVFVSLFTVAVAALRWTWRNVAIPGWQVMKAAVRLAEIHTTVDKSLPILQELNEKWSPNGGVSLHDTITRLDRGQAELRDDMKGIRALIEVHISSVQRGGRRTGDPQ